MNYRQAKSILYEIIVRIFATLDRIGYFLKRCNLPRVIVDSVLLPPDLYKIYTSHKAAMGEYPHLIRPRSFNDWMQHSKVLFRKPRHVVMADKLRSRQYLAGKVDENMLTKIFWEGNDLRYARLASLPNSFVIKANHSSGDDIFVKDATTFDWDPTFLETSRMLADDYSRNLAEWQYRWISPKLFIEEYLEAPGGGSPVEYQFFCIRGTCCLVEADIDRHANHSRLFFDRTFSRLDLKIRLPAYLGELKKPPFFEEMLGIAEKLASDELFLRVDFYDIGRPIIGELTFHPAGGTVKFDPPEWNLKLGTYFRRKIVN